MAIKSGQNLLHWPSSVVVSSAKVEAARTALNTRVQRTTFLEALRIPTPGAIVAKAPPNM